MFRQAGSSRSTLSGIFMMLGAFVIFATLDSSAKYLGRFLSVGEITLGRYAFGILFAALAGRLLAGGGFWRTRHPRLQMLRGAFMFGATFFNFMAVRHLQLAVTSAILFAAPLLVCALSALLLGEHVGWRRWAAVLAGFAGVILIIRPGTAAFHPAMLYSIAAAFTLAAYQVLTRKVGARDNAFASVFWATLVGTLLSVPLLLATGVSAPTPYHAGAWVALVWMGLAGTIGHVLLSEAHRRADASLLAPFAYSQMLWMVLIGWWWFGDVPDVPTIIGALIVAAAGLFVFHREQQVAARHETMRKAVKKRT